MDRDLRPWRTVARQTLCRPNKFLRVELHTVELPDGRTIDDWSWVVTPDYTNTLAVTPDGRFLCFRQVKYAISGITLAAPGGFLEPGEAPLAGAQRELREETGYSAADWLPLGSFWIDPNRGIGRAHFFLALGAEPSGPTHADDLEDQHLVLLTRDELDAALAAGQFQALSWTGAIALALHKLDALKR